MGRIPELDGVRGLAAALILCYHVTHQAVPAWGWAGVDIFFVLSGYLITTIILKNQGSLKFLLAFYARRGLRIWPIYYSLIVFCLCTSQSFQDSAYYYLTYTQEIPRYWGGIMPGFTALQHTWTLAIEEQFYLIWPLLVLLVKRRWVGHLSLLVVISSISARAIGVHWWLLAARADGFALGGFLAAFFVDPITDRAKRLALTWAYILGSSGLVLAAANIRGDLGDINDSIGSPISVTASTFLAFAAIATIVCFKGRRFLAPLRFAPLQYIGTISYGLYLYHQTVIFHILPKSNILGLSDGPSLWVAQVGLSIVIASLSWQFFERPILRFKTLVPYSKD